METVGPSTDTAVADYKHQIEGTIKRTGFEKFYRRDGSFVNTLAKKAADLRKDKKTVLSKPENVSRLVELALYHPVFYCDNSTSMSLASRFQTQKDLVIRMADIATKIAPDGYSVDLQFINDKHATRRISSKDDLLGVLENTGLRDSTRIGTVLNRRILKPLVYNKLKSKSGLSRPLLVCIITDGCPTAEPVDTLSKKIAECKKKLTKKGYRPPSVMFCISQIGDDSKATDFLHDLERKDDIRDVLHRTADRLDGNFQELQKNHDTLDEWLLEVLSTPIMMKQE